MSKYMYCPEDRVPYTRKSPKCPKCGGKTRRIYQIGEDMYGPYYNSGWSGVEFLKVYCQDCDYEFPQYVRTPNKEE